MSKTHHAVAALLLFLLPASAAWGDDAGAPLLTVDEVVAAAGFDDRQRSDLLAGKIVTKDFDEGSDKEMSILVALKAPVPLTKVWDFWQQVRILDADEDLIEVGRIGPDQDAAQALAGAGFTAEEADEVRGLLEVERGSDFNLSEQEIRRFAAVAEGRSSGGCGHDDACRSAVNDTYRSVLAQRLDAYRKGGLKAVATYARSRGKVADPREEMRLAAEQMPMVRQHAPEIYRAWLEYPRAQPEGSQHQFLWLKRNLEGRPTFVLTHRAIYETEGAVFAAERHFYVGQFYNSLQMASYTTALGSESIHFLLNRTSTDLVAGFGTSAKKKIGRSKVRKALIGTFERLLATLD